MNCPFGHARKYKLSLQRVQSREQEKEILYCGVQVCIQLCLGLYCCVLVLLVGIQMVQDMDQHVSELSPNHAVVLYNDAYRFLSKKMMLTDAVLDK